MKSDQKNTKLVMIGMLGATAFLLMLLDFPIFAGAPYLKIDFSGIPALLGTFTFGPVVGILVELIKNILHLWLRDSEPVGHLANFIGGITFILPVYLVSRKSQSKKKVVIGLLLSTICLALVMAILNYTVLLPLYTKMSGFNLSGAKAFFQTIINFTIPFNLIKGTLVSLVFLWIYPKMKSFMKRYTKAD